MKSNIQSMALAVAIAFAGGAYAADAAEKQIDADHKAALELCKPLKGNAQDVCKKEADGKKNVAKAELKLQKKDSAENRREVAEAKAKAEYVVAHERCDDQKGDAKNACQKEAKSKRDSALAAAKSTTTSSTGPMSK